MKLNESGRLKLQRLHSWPQAKHSKGNLRNLDLLHVYKDGSLNAIALLEFSSKVDPNVCIRLLSRGEDMLRKVGLETRVGDSRHRLDKCLICPVPTAAAGAVVHVMMMC